MQKQKSKEIRKNLSDHGITGLSKRFSGRDLIIARKLAKELAKLKIHPNSPLCMSCNQDSLEVTKIVNESICEKKCKICQKKFGVNLEFGVSLPMSSEIEDVHEELSGINYILNLEKNETKRISE